MLQRARKTGKVFENPVRTKVGGASLMFKVLPLYLGSRGVEKKPKTPPGPFHTQASVYDTPPGSGLRVTWFGHSSMLVEIDGVRVLIDPVWDRRAAPVRWAGPKRFFPPTTRLEDMPALDAILISHNHYDHLGKQTIKALARMESMRAVKWITSLGVGRILQRFGVAASCITELDWTERTAVGAPGTAMELAVTALPARHFSGRGVLRNRTLWSSFVLKGTSHTVYYGADSGWWDGFTQIARQYGPFDLTMLEVGAFHPLWSDIHLGPDNAVYAFRAMGSVGAMMPIHWGLFDLALHGWRQPIQRVTVLADEGRVRLWSPEPGVPTEVVAGTEVRSDWWRR